MSVKLRVHSRKKISRDLFWNTAGSLIYALMSMVLAFFVMRTQGAEDGGIFGFGFSTFGQQMFIVAYFGIRPFQITDVKGEYTFGEYKRFRFLTSGLAVFAAAVWLGTLLISGEYTAYKALIIGLLAVYKIFDGYADVYESEFQRDGKLYLAGQLLALRTLCCGGVFMLALLLRHDLLFAGLLAAALQAVFMGVYRAVSFRAFPNRRRKGVFGGAGNRRGKLAEPANTENLISGGAGYSAEQGDVKAEAASAGLLIPERTVRSGRVSALFRGTVLLFLSVFLDFYVFSAAKYAVDLRLTDADNGIFNLLFMPTNIIYLAANFVIKPFMTYLAAAYEMKDFARFTEITGKITKLIAALTACCCAGALLLGGFVLRLGEVVLGAGYQGMLSAHKTAFIIIIFGGGIYALANLYYYVLVIMRRQKAIFGIYVAAAAAAFFLAPALVGRFTIGGAALGYTLLMLALCGGFFLLGRGNLKKAQAETKSC